MRTLGSGNWRHNNERKGQDYCRVTTGLQTLTVYRRFQLLNMDMYMGMDRGRGRPRLRGQMPEMTR